MTNTRASELHELQSYTELQSFRASELRIQSFEQRCENAQNTVKHCKTPQNTVLFEIL